MLQALTVSLLPQAGRFWNYPIRILLISRTCTVQDPPWTSNSSPTVPPLPPDIVWTTTDSMKHPKMDLASSQECPITLTVKASKPYRWAWTIRLSSCAKTRDSLRSLMVPEVKWALDLAIHSMVEADTTNLIALCRHRTLRDKRRDWAAITLNRGMEAGNQVFSVIVADWVIYTRGITPLTRPKIKWASRDPKELVTTIAGSRKEHRSNPHSSCTNTDDAEAYINLCINFKN